MKRIAVIDKERCNPVGCGGYLCIKKCPLNRMGLEAIVVGPDGKAQINEEVATDACQVCVNICPFNAIHMVNLPDQLTKRPMHRYSKDGFILYSLPTPIFGKVLGVVGVNGIGKSTAIKILAGVLKPNLGNPDAKEATVDDLIKMFKGTEAQIFFEKVKKNQITISYKPQEVEAIQRKAQGTVKELLKKIDKKGKLDKIAEQLEITPILENDIQKISGGEMQRVAIAATVLKQASLYIFDEPSSYLDIKQRFKVAQFIKSLADENTAILVIEHDLIALDYMADLITIMYGKEKVYGIASQPKPAKAGINAYLEGHLREDNVRFREYKIGFSVSSKEKKRRKDQLTSWKPMEKKLGKFHLATTEGAVHRQEIIGIVGPNGIGKTTFVKLLAGIEKPDKGEPLQHIAISYKPQAIAVPEEKTVMEFLEEVIKKHTNDIINPLNIKDLYSQKLSTLSGGELQRVVIAHALGQKADLVLLDEPSAYLDIEQRLIVAKVIRHLADTTGKSILVVDHDLVFLDFLSDCLIVFEGTPARDGKEIGPLPMEDGMNALLREVGITLRREEASGRPRTNKPGSVMDREQKDSGRLYYS